MLGEYGTDDLPWLIEQSGGDAVRIGTGDTETTIPTTVFDNRTDHTSFLRADPASWSPEQVEELREELMSVFEKLAQ
jgi:hypothetical protein